MVQEQLPGTACCQSVSEASGHVDAGAGETTTVQDALSHRTKRKKVTQSVTVVEPPSGRHVKQSWVWKIMQEFLPAVNGKNVRCRVEVCDRGRKRPCGALFKWIPENGTSGMSKRVSKAPRFTLQGYHHHNRERSVPRFLVSVTKPSLSCWYYSSTFNV